MTLMVRTLGQRLRMLKDYFVFSYSLREGKNGHTWVSRNSKIWLGIGSRIYAFHLEIGPFSLLWDSKRHG